MTTLHDAHDALRLLTEACVRLHPTAELTEIDEASWLVTFGDEDEGCLVEWSERWSRLVLTAELGMPSEDVALAAYKRALAYNATWHDVGSLRIAMDDEDGVLLLIGEIAPDDDLADGLAPVLQQFDELRRWWKAAIDSPSPVASTDPSQAPSFIQRA